MCKLYINTKTFYTRDLSMENSAILRGPGTNSLWILRLYSDSKISLKKVNFKVKVKCTSYYTQNRQITRSYCTAGNGTPLQYSCLENPMD